MACAASGSKNLKRVSNSADSAKTRFVLIDAVGVEQSIKTDSRPLERKPHLAMKDILQGVTIGHRDDDTVLSLANRLIRLAKQLDDRALARIEKVSGGVPLHGLGKALIAALDPDRIVETALATAKEQGITRTEESFTDPELAVAKAQRVAAACAPFDNPELRDALESARASGSKSSTISISIRSRSRATRRKPKNRPKKLSRPLPSLSPLTGTRLPRFSFFYQQPYQRRQLTFDMIEELHNALSRPPLMLTTERLWSAYARVRQIQVKGAAVKRYKLSRYDYFGKSP